MYSVAFIVAANLLPLAGVIWWGWDAFILLLLYWCETVVIAFWTMVRILVGPAALGKSAGFAAGAPGRIAMALFLSIHSGIFITVHFVFLWFLFAGPWRAIVQGPASFVRDLILGTDLWFPLAVLFLVHGYFAIGPLVRARLGLTGDDAAESAAPVGGLYVRIFVMQFTIIVGGWFAMMAGNTFGPLALLILLKTLAEVYADPVAKKVVWSGFRASS